MGHPSAFVLMPFANDLQEVYDLFIRPSLEQAGYLVIRADDISNQRNILEDIVKAIEGSDLIVADLTGENPNVYYELGIAHALGKPVVLLTQNVKELPFDLKSYRVIPYDIHFADIDKAKGELSKIAETAKSGHVEFGNPVSDFLRFQGRAELRKAPAHQPETSAGVEHEEEGDPGFLDRIIDLEDSFAVISEVAELVG